MMRRLLEVFRRPPPPSRPRPNELRLDQVRAERLRREAMRASLPASAEEEVTSARRVTALAAPKKQRRPLLLGERLTRKALRRAIVLGEIIEPPLSLRDAGIPPDLRH